MARKRRSKKKKGNQGKSNRSDGMSEEEGEWSDETKTERERQEQLNPNIADMFEQELSTNPNHLLQFKPDVEIGGHSRDGYSPQNLKNELSSSHSLNQIPVPRDDSGQLMEFLEEMDPFEAKVMLSDIAYSLVSQENDITDTAMLINKNYDLLGLYGKYHVKSVEDYFDNETRQFSRQAYEEDKKDTGIESESIADSDSSYEIGSSAFKRKLYQFEKLEFFNKSGSGSLRTEIHSASVKDNGGEIENWGQDLGELIRQKRTIRDMALWYRIKLLKTRADYLSNIMKKSLQEFEVLEL